MKKILMTLVHNTILLVLLISIPFFTVPGDLTAAGGKDDRIAGLIEGAKKEGKLTIYGGGSAETFGVVTKQFQIKYPFIKVEYYRASTARMLIKILNEARAKRHIADVFQLGALQMYVVKKNGLLIQYLSPERDAYPEYFKDSQGYYTTFTYATDVIAYNTNLVSPSEAPKSLQDLLAPRWKGKLGLPTNGEKWFTCLMKNMGEEKARDFAKKLAKQEPILRSGLTLNTMLLAAGEFPVLVNTYGWIVEERKSQGAPIEWVRAEPISTDNVMVSLTAHSPHPNSAKLYIDYLLSQEGQEVLRGLFRIPARSGLDPIPPRLNKGLKLSSFDPDWGADYARYEEEFANIFLKKKK